MNHLTKSAVLALALGVTLGVGAEEVIAPPETLDFDQFRSAAYLPGKADAIQNGRIIYEVKGKDVPTSYLMIRGNRDHQIRIDIVTAEGLFSACRNGDNYWGYSKESGKVPLAKDEIEEMKIDTPFFPLPFQKNDFYAPLTFTGNGFFGTAECRCYDTKPLNGNDFQMTIWVDNADKRICLITSKSAEGVYSTSFRNYRDFGGIELATRLHLSSPEGVMNMTVKSAEWNVKFADGIFNGTGDIANDPRLAELQKWLGERDAAKAKKLQEKAAADKAKLEQEQKAVIEREAARQAVRDQKAADMLKKKIAEIDSRIAEKTQALNKLEALVKQDTAGAEQAKEDYKRNPYTYRHAWTYHGWRGWGGRWRSSTHRHRNNEQRRLAKTLDKNAKDSAKEYDKIAAELNMLQLQRAEAQAQLDKLQAK